MAPKIFELVSVDPTLITLIGGTPFRFFPAGEAPQDVTKPYCIWTLAGGRPENFLADAPDMDGFTLQIDCYAPTLVAARSLARAVRTAIEARAHIQNFLGEARDEDTKLYVVGFDVEWFEPIIN